MGSTEPVWRPPNSRFSWSGQQPSTFFSWSFRGVWGSSLDLADNAVHLKTGLFYRFTVLSLLVHMYETGLTSSNSLTRSREEGWCSWCLLASRSKYEMVSKMVLWIPWHGQRKPALTYIDILTKDTGLETAELEMCMKESNIWRSNVARSGR